MPGPGRPVVVVSDAELADRLAHLRERIAAAGGAGVRVVGVTKTFPRAAVDAAGRVGLTAVGESYAQEVVDKFAASPAPIPVHFIGHLQTNKVRALRGLVDVVSSVDRAGLVDELAKRTPGMRVLLQINATGESTKFGCPPGTVDGLYAHALDAGLHVEGLMAMGPTDGDRGVARRAFRRTRALTDRLGLAVCSMGMSDDLDIAVGEGSTEVRVGTALFGTRPRTH